MSRVWGGNEKWFAIVAEGPSRRNEGMANVMLEAILSQTPVIGSDVTRGGSLRPRALTGFSAK